MIGDMRRFVQKIEHTLYIVLLTVSPDSCFLFALPYLFLRRAVAKADIVHNFASWLNEFMNLSSIPKHARNRSHLAKHPACLELVPGSYSVLLVLNARSDASHDVISVGSVTISVFITIMSPRQIVTFYDQNRFKNVLYLICISKIWFNHKISMSLRRILSLYSKYICIVRLATIRLNTNFYLIIICKI